MGSSVLNVKVVVAAFNQEKALAFSVITNLRMELFQALVSPQSTIRISDGPLLLSVFYPQVQSRIARYCCAHAGVDIRYCCACAHEGGDKYKQLWATIEEPDRHFNFRATNIIFSRENPAINYILILIIGELCSCKIKILCGKLNWYKL